MKRFTLLVVTFLTFLFFGGSIGLAVNHEIKITQSKTAPKLDGEINEKEWSGSVALKENLIDRFTGKRMEETSVFYLMQCRNFIYLAFSFEENPEKIVAKMSKDQSNLSNDDYVSLTLDPFHNHTDLSYFYLNPLGVKMWSISGGTATKREWSSGGFTGVAKITETGWQGEIGINLDKIPHGDIEKVGIGFNVSRKQQHKDVLGDLFPMGKIGHPIEDVDKEKMGDLVGFALIEAKGNANANIMPYIFCGEEYDNNKDQWQFRHREGADIKVSLSNSITAIVSVLSDVENIEGQVEGIDFEYSERYVSDRRPFWLEGAGYRETYGAFHSGRVRRTDIGMSVFGKPTPKTSGGVFFSYGKDEGVVSILSSGAILGSKTGMGLTFVNYSGYDTSLLQAGIGTQANWFSTGGNITLMRNSKEKVVGERYLQHITFSLSNYVIKTVPYYTSKNYINPIGYERFIGIWGSQSSISKTFKHKSFLQESKISLYNDTGNFTDSSIYRRTFGVSANFTTKSDMSVSGQISAGKYDEYKDGTLLFKFRGRRSDPKNNFGCSLETGWRQEEPMTYATCYGSVSVKGLISSLTIAKLWHVEDMNLFTLTFAYEFTPEIGIYGRAISRNKETNCYAGFRKSGYAGTEIHTIVGSPNIGENQNQKTWMQKRLVIKVVRAFSL